MLLMRGVRHSAVRSVREMLGFLGFGSFDSKGRYTPLDSAEDFDAVTESVVVDFQRAEGLLADGVVGPSTLRLLERTYATRLLELNSPGIDALMGTPDRVLGLPDRLILERVPADPTPQGGYDRLSLRSDVAAKYREAYRKVREQGGLMTSSAGLRSLQAPWTRSRSATSFHYLGRAFDLHFFSGMVDPASDPYVVSREQPGRYRVFARCSKANNPDAKLPPAIEVPKVVTYKQRTRGTSVKGRFLDLTALLKGLGFKPIPARRRFEEGRSMMGAEWWHFQDESGLVEGQSTFGLELLKIYSKATLEGTAPWTNRDRIYGINWF